MAEWDNDPLLPRAVIVKLPGEAADEAPRITAVLAPAAMVNGLAGFALTPLGRPLNVI